jgi:pilus assembly protein CpaB
MKKSLIIAGIVGLVAALVVAGFLNSIESKYRKGAQKVNVLVAKEYLEQGTMLDETLVEMKTVPKEYVQPKALASVKDLVDSEGRQLFLTVVPVEKGEQVVTTKLFMLGMDTGLSAVVPTDKRAITMVFDRDMVSGVVKPGNKVDIIGVFEYYDKNNNKQDAAVTVLQNITILAVGKSILGQVKPMLKSKKDMDKSMSVESTESKVPISFALTPTEAETLMLASEKAIIRLSLRATGDDKPVISRGSRLAEIVKDLGTDKKFSSQGESPDAAKMQEDYQKKLQDQQKAMELLKKYQQNQGQ